MTTVPIAAEQEPDTTVTLLHPGDGTGLVRCTVLPGGLRVVTETIPGVRVWLAGAFFVVSAFFVYRSFYGMRIESTSEAAAPSKHTV